MALIKKQIQITKEMNIIDNNKLNEAFKRFKKDFGFTFQDLLKEPQKYQKVIAESIYNNDETTKKFCGIYDDSQIDLVIHGTFNDEIKNLYYCETCECGYIAGDELKCYKYIDIKQDCSDYDLAQYFKDNYKDELERLGLL